MEPSREPARRRERRTKAARERTIRLLTHMAPEPRPFAVRLWDGTVLPAAVPEPEATLVLADPDALGRALAAPIDLSAGEAFVRGDIDVEGDLQAVLGAADVLLDHAAQASLLARVRGAGDVTALRRQAARHAVDGTAELRGRRHTRDRDTRAVRHHYDLPADFYRLWLDRRMAYSCGYFAEGDESLDEAQEAKVEHICRKLRLAPGQRLLDIGCGWGSLTVHAAERHGAEVLGITLAEHQIEETNDRLRALGAADRAEAQVLDYRDVRGTFDRIASVGMSEHVGRAGLEAYFRAAWERLRPGGLMLNHAITRGPRGHAGGPMGPDSFIGRYVFPDGEIVDLAETLRAAEAAGFEVRDVEDLREHYTRTLRHWVANLEARWDDAVALVGSERARIWRLYMAASAHQFARGRLSVHQALLGRPDDRGRVEVPPSRSDLYASPPAGEVAQAHAKP